jgi:hypothetical protein
MSVGLSMAGEYALLDLWPCPHDLQRYAGRAFKNNRDANPSKEIYAALTQLREVRTSGRQCYHGRETPPLRLGLQVRNPIPPSSRRNIPLKLGWFNLLGQVAITTGIR